LRFFVKRRYQGAEMAREGREMTDIQLEALIALIEERAEEAAKSPDEARRHLVEAGILSDNGKLSPEYAEDDANEAAAA
jgi:hypothetical protein